jgi:uncharacterized membrane protein YtjA (UPF0391 family)
VVYIELRILAACGILWLIQTVLGVLTLKEPAGKVIFVVALVLVLVWLVSGQVLVLR